MYKFVLVLCAQALFIQSALSQCTSRAAVADHADIGYGLRSPYCYGLEAPWGLDGAYGWGLEGAYGYGGSACGTALEYSPTSGGGLAVSSASAVAPVGLSVASENVYEGKLASAGELPFVGTVGVEGVLPTAGAGAVNHHCGDGINAMVSDGIRDAYGLGYERILDRGIGFGLEAPALGYRGWAHKGCGCGTY